MRVVGLMSGTSVDGIDAALAEIWRAGDGQIRLRMLAFETLPWSPAQRATILRLLQNRGTVQELCRANFDLGRAFGQAALHVIRAAGLSPAQVNLIGSHGQTVWHEVMEGRVHATLQIGEAAVIQEVTGIPTVGNFRVADVAAGGQGAPLVPIFDWLLLRPPAGSPGWRAAQNIGGIGNVTLLPPQEVDGDPIAFDTGPGNTLIDWAAANATHGQATFDRDGLLARQGTVHPGLLADWLAHPYFAQEPPKSTGRELFSGELAQSWWDQAQAAGCSPVDFVATVTELTGVSIAQAIHRFAPGPVMDLIVAGGGAANPVLMERLAHALAQTAGRPIPVKRAEEIPDLPIEGGLNSDAKEALCFALLAWLHHHGEPGNLPSCTGAKGPRLLGR